MGDVGAAATVAKLGVPAVSAIDDDRSGNTTLGSEIN